MIILPSVLYGLHVVWGGSLNVDLLNSLEILHRRVARVIYNLPARDMRTGEVYRRSKLHTLTFYSYKLRLIKMLHSVFIGEANSAALSYLTNKPCKAYNFTKRHNITVPRFNSYTAQKLWARSIQPKFRPVRPVKEDHLKRWTSFFETFPAGPNRSIEF